MSVPAAHSAHDCVPPFARLSAMGNTLPAGEGWDPDALQIEVAQPRHSETIVGGGGGLEGPVTGKQQRRSPKIKHTSCTFFKGILCRLMGSYPQFYSHT